jgi:hypothetical protein
MRNKSDLQRDVASFDVIPACPESFLLKMQFNYDSRQAGMTARTEDLSSYN